LSTFPDASHFQLSFICAVIGVALIILVPSLIPDFTTQSHIARLIKQASSQEATNPIQAGQFADTVHSYTTVSPKSTFYGVSILTSGTGKKLASLQNLEKTKRYVQQLESKDFNQATKDIYEGILMMKGLGTLQSESVNNYYQFILQLAESNSGFRLDNLHSASLSATYYAFKAIEALGKFSDFEKTDKFQSAVNFVWSLQNPNNTLFTEVGQNETIEATFHAIEVLSMAKQSLNTSESFLNYFQAQDGGYSNTPLMSLRDFYATSGDIVASVRAMTILYRLGSSNSNGISFLKAQMNPCFRDEMTLEEIYFLINFLETTQISLGSSRTLQTGAVSVGVFFLIYALQNFYKPQMSPEESFAGSEYKIFVWAAFLVAGAAAVEFSPPAAVVVYLLFAFYLIFDFYEIQSTDTTPDGLMLLLASIISLLYMGFAISLTYFSPYVYAQVNVLFLLLTGQAVACAATTFFAQYWITPKQRVSWYVKAGVLASILNTLLFLAYLYGRGDAHILFRLFDIKGLFPAFYIGLPLQTLAVGYFFSAFGFFLYSAK